MNQNKENTVKVELTGWAYGGDALGREADGRMIFAPFCAPGETVRGPVIDERRSWARIEPIQWLSTSPERIEARCPHFTDCGGCHYQHLGYESQLRAKSRIVAEQLERIGGLKDPPMMAAVASPQAWAYRNHMRYQVLPDGSLGFMRHRENRPLPITACYLPLPELQELWPRFEIPEGSPIEQVSLRVGNSGDPMAILHGPMAQVVELQIDFPISTVWQDGESWRVLAGDDHIVFEIAGRSFRVSPASFFQVNTSILPVLVERVMAALRLETGMTFFDLYAGVGLFSAFASPCGTRVFAMEASSAACADFEWNLRDCDEVFLYEAPVEVALPSLGERPDVVLVDPPRSGLSKAVVDAILALQPEHLVYLSCDPSTLARDAKRLDAGGFQLEAITPIDIFPQTFHIETLSSWQLR